MRIQPWKLAVIVAAAAYGIWIGILVVPSIVRAVVPEVVKAILG